MIRLFLNVKQSLEKRQEEIAKKEYKKQVLFLIGYALVMVMGVYTSYMAYLVNGIHTLFMLVMFVLGICLTSVAFSAFINKLVDIAGVGIRAKDAVFSNTLHNENRIDTFTDSIEVVLSDEGVGIVVTPLVGKPVKGLASPVKNAYAEKDFIDYSEIFVCSFGDEVVLNFTSKVRLENDKVLGIRNMSEVVLDDRWEGFNDHREEVIKLLKERCGEKFLDLSGDDTESSNKAVESSEYNSEESVERSVDVKDIDEVDSTNNAEVEEEANKESEESKPVEDVEEQATEAEGTAAEESGEPLESVKEVDEPTDEAVEKENK